MYEEFLCYNVWFECVLRNFLYFDILKIVGWIKGWKEENSKIIEFFLVYFEYFWCFFFLLLLRVCLNYCFGINFVFC